MSGQSRSSSHNRCATAVRPRNVPIFVSVAICLILPRTSAADSATFVIASATGRDTISQGLHQRIRFMYDPGTDTLVSCDISMLWSFSNGNIIGPLYDTGVNPNVVVTEDAIAVFEAVGWGLIPGNNSSDPDTTTCSARDVVFDSQWVSFGAIWELVVNPTDTGTIQINRLPPEHFWTFFGSPSGAPIPTAWQAPLLTVVPCQESGLVWGDSNLDGVVSSSDVIKIVNHVFKSGPPAPVFELMDINCTGDISAADIILLVNYIFKAGGAPCNPC